MAAEQDVEVEDDLARAQKRLRELKGRISAQSKKNFVLERDVRYLDSRIALLIANRMALDEQSEVASTLEETDSSAVATALDDRKMQQYGNLFFLLQSEPRHIAALCRLVSLAEIDTLLQTVMFTLYGNQYESREEHLLLTMFQSVLSAQFETATEFGSLLRANTPVSRMMTTYTRRGPGQSYLKSVLAERINSLIEHKDLNLEVNPLKVYEQMINQIEEDTGSLPPNLPRGVPAEVAAENADVQAIIAPRLTMLMEIANSFLLTIINSIDEVPYGIRWICKQIRSLTKRKYPRRHRVRHLLPHRRLLLPPLHQPGHRHAAGLHARRRPARQASASHIDAHRKDAPEPRKQALVRKGAVHDVAQSLCREQQDAHERLSQCSLRRRRLLRDARDGSVHGTLQEGPPDPDHPQRALQHPLARRTAPRHPRPQRQAPPPHPHRRTRRLARSGATQGEPHARPAPLLALGDAHPRPHHRLHVREQRDAERHPLHGDQVDLCAAAAFHPHARREAAHQPAADRRARRHHQRRHARAQGHQGQGDAARARGAQGGGSPRRLQPHDRRGGHRAHPPRQHARKGDAGDAQPRGRVQDHLRRCAASRPCTRPSASTTNYMRSQLDTYKSYLQNVRMTSGSAKDKNAGGVGVISVGGKEKKAPKTQALGPYRFTHAQMEKDGIIVESNVPENRRANIFFNITSPSPGTFIIALH
ncbi:hypothetical protein L1887_53015 [Cichorium endivia]|nr:hypothetical protein L1887_53015 [Cichorium endivia]